MFTWSPMERVVIPEQIEYEFQAKEDAVNGTKEKTPPSPAHIHNEKPKQDPPDAGKVLYEERRALLKGLWMPDAPPWEELPEETKERWRGYAV